ncbi:MAG: DNA alkylation repair protein [Deltaproteobacteria bacterium]|nr:DNA alkylation repair protein [Deltaproteobacteria bacterium]
MAERIGLAFSRFDSAAFVEAVMGNGYASLELKDRIKRIAEGLHEYLPSNYEKTLAILKKVAPDVSDFENWCLTTYVELYGLESFEASMDALENLTRHGTGEFAIRPFVIRYTDRVLPIMHRWAEDNNEHVRRLAAEGSRPRGVWVAHVAEFKKNPRPVIEILDKLKADPSLYVRKAVANNLNDISKDNPEVAIKTARRWQKNGQKTTAWIIKHGCRSLIKQGHPDVFGLLGFTEKPKVEVGKLRTSRKKVKIGDSFEILAEINSLAKTEQRLAIDYRVHYRKANGKLAPKVFKLAERTLAAGETVSLSTSHSFRTMTTRKHYPGGHEIELVINGRTCDRVAFHLTS